MSDVEFVTINCRDLKKSPEEVIKWCRKNFGERGNGWDFHLLYSKNSIQLAIWDERIKFMYEMWVQ